RVELWGDDCDAIAYDHDGSLHAHDTRGVVAWLTGSLTATRLTGHTLRGAAWIWDTLLLPRRRRTLYGLNDDDGRMLDWRTGDVVSLRAWMDPHAPRGASIFSLAASGDETCIAFGGKHWYVNVLRTSPAFEPLSCEQLHGGGRVLVVAHHPRRDVL